MTSAENLRWRLPNVKRFLPLARKQSWLTLPTVTMTCRSSSGHKYQVIFRFNFIYYSAVQINTFKGCLKYLTQITFNHDFWTGEYRCGGKSVDLFSTDAARVMQFLLQGPQILLHICIIGVVKTFSIVTISDKYRIVQLVFTQEIET